MNISFKFDNFKLNYRVAAIIEHDGRFLLQKSVNDIFYSLVGGRVELGEDSYSSIIRELEEELGIKLTNDDISLISIVENFFHHTEIDFHEMLFLFKVKLDDSFEIVNKKDFPVMDKETSILNWYTEEEIKSFDLRPELAKDILNQTFLSHIINKEI